ncbi:MAG TPA: hypothetical protein PKE39_05375 [Ignavibacteria bacterium]|nr:hypothetical protein [Ignavibacteria bacterium]HMQ98434.1 hypothetical protein [Ignavibacteria bacterium]
MKASKLITILKTFSGEDLKRFEKFIISPYHNSGRNLKPLFKAVTKFHPDYPEDKLSGEKILKSLRISSGGYNKSSSSQLAVRYSELTRLAKNFLVVENSLNNSFAYSKTLAEYYNDKNLYNYCRSEIKECNRILDESGLDENYALERLLLQRIISLSYHRENKKDKALKEILHIPLYALSYFVTNIKVQLYSNHLEYPVNYALLKKITDSLNIEELAKLCTDDNSGLKNKMIYDHKRSLFYLYENTELFWELIEFYKMNFDQLSDVLKWQYFLGLMKSGTKLMSTRDFTLFATQLSLLIDFVFQNGVFSFSRKEPLEDVLFNSILRIKISIESPEKVQEFIEKYLPKVKPGFRERTKNYAFAFLSFKEGNFTKSLECLNRINSSTLSEKNYLYKLKIAVFYELKYTEELYYLLDSYNHFIANNTRFSKQEEHFGFSGIVKTLLSHEGKNNKLLKNVKNKMMDSIKTSDLGWWVEQKINEF